MSTIRDIQNNNRIATAVSTEEWKFKDQCDFTAPAGTYYIGDVCYALPNSFFDGVFRNIGDYCVGLYSKGDDFIMIRDTAYGDGSYRGSDGNVFDVDAGIIGIVPINICDMGKSTITAGHIYTFDKPVTCYFGGGLFAFTENGCTRLLINTADDEIRRGECRCHDR